ncbi:hypothetical protein [Gordonia neofelifaecis]|uniref:DUF1634 domain-containing protein n=1 Tax=Gordonia neofelifaecis NRRL B-59395 TaxID=644548 RepID=F1YNS5_9ACTN|nr:hypothetical protein [Gordonia neofelifaecis]EGD53682.1 hypothetical protein SCNU_17857 [Gordonia neofelifaecis NRRL B-59395]
MTGTTTTGQRDRRLRERIAVLMRAGCTVSAAVLIVGVVLSAFGTDRSAAAFLCGGCAILILLPVARLVLMSIHFRSTAPGFVPVCVLVLCLIGAGAAGGCWI